MKFEALQYLRCPVTHSMLHLVTTQQFEAGILPQGEIKEGYLFSDEGMYYPIISGIPRMLPESMLAHQMLLHKLVPDFENIKQAAMRKFGTIITKSASRNKKIQETFGFEWSLLNKGEGIKIWNHSPDSYKLQLQKELNISTGTKFNMALDAGCGHGRTAMLMADFCDVAFGVEVSRAVELGYAQNVHHNCHFIQADVHHLPFEKERFDLLYSSGVLHHNPNTLDALTNIMDYLNPRGLLCIWLYHPFKNMVHWIMRNYRYITRNMHVKIVYTLNCISITPLQWVISHLGKQKKKWTEVSIEQLDMLTPKYRHEHTQQEVKNWLEQKHFTNIKVTDSDNYGFSINGNKN